MKASAVKPGNEATKKDAARPAEPLHEKDKEALTTLLIVKGLACYLLFGNPTEKEKESIVEILRKLEKQSET